MSTVLAGYASDKFGSGVAFTGLACVAALGLADDLAGDAGDAARAVNLYAEAPCDTAHRSMPRKCPN